MPRYRAFGLAVDSQLELPELVPAADAGDADVRVERAGLDDAAAPDGYRELGPETVHLTTDAGTLRVEDGARIAVDPADGAGPAAVRALVLGLGFAALCHQRGHLVLHGSALAVDGRAVAVVGPSGAGKSTLAAALAARGHRVLADDLAVIEADAADGSAADVDEAVAAGSGAADATPALRPAFPALKLAPETVGPDGGPGWTPIGDGTVGGKRFYRPPGWSGPGAWSAAPRELALVVVLAVGERRRVAALSGGEGVAALVGSSYTAGVLDETAARERHFRDCARVVDGARVVELQRASADSPTSEPIASDAVPASSDSDAASAESDSAAGSDGSTPAALARVVEEELAAATSSGSRSEEE